MKTFGRHALLGLVWLFSLPSLAAPPACTALFTSGVQSHSPNGRVDFGYMSRVVGSGPTVTAPSLTMTHTWQDQAALCDGVVCTATGTTSAASAPDFLTGSDVPGTFLSSTGADGAINLGYQSTANRAVGNYAAVSVGQEARLTFSSAGASYRTRALTTEYRAVVEFQPGDYWIDGNVSLGEQTVLRRLAGATGAVRLYVNGSISAGQFSLDGFAQGQIHIYATGNVSMGNNIVIPGFVHARGSVTFGQSPVIGGGVFAGSYATGNNAQITYSAVGGSNRMGSFTADHQAVIQMQAGDYWYNGNFVLNQVTLRRLTGGSGPVRIFVNGRIDINFAARFEGFAAGQLLIYSTQNIFISSQQRVPAFIYAAGDVDIGYQSGVDGAVAGRVVKIGQQSVVNYVAPNDLAPLCDPQPVRTCLSDSFNRSSLGTTDWAVTSRNGSFGVPRIVGNRLRLTDNTGNVATGATLQRLLPAAGNLVEIEFKYYAYNGSGADGVAVIFSDASITPQPGGYGGSLGYAQLNGTSGFSGGWLGVALDEFGNYSNPTETRVGGQGLRQDSVAIRGSGSGTSGYRYLRGTAANLNPGIDVSGTTAGPGHTYRIRLDSRTSGRTLVSVERNTGSGYASLIAPFDVQAEAGQAALPANFFVTFTGSTGGSTNIHELDDLSLCADRMDGIGQQIDHFRFVYSAEAVTCSSQPVQVRACLNSDCSSLFSGPVSITLAPASGWSAVAPASLSAGNVLSFSGGVANALLRSGSVGAVTLGVTASTPATRPLSVPVCSTANCRINYAASGFIFDIPTLIAARPQDGVLLRAVRSSDNAQVCLPHFADVSRTLQFTSAYVDPGTGTRPVVVNGIDVGATPANVMLAFDQSGTARLNVRYDDAGQMRLSASYSGSAASGDSGLNMTGSDPFVSKPYGLCLETNANCSAAGVGSGCPVFVKAGDPFPLRVRAVGWQSDGEALTAAALCSGNITTPNFRLADIALGSSLIAPSGGVAADVSPASYGHVLGSQTTTSIALSEVGVFNLTATPPANGYFGETVGGGSSAMVGRVTPAYLSAQGSAALAPACGAFSYQDQPIDFLQNPQLTVTGLNRQGAVTRNYDRGDFWRMPLPVLVDPRSKIPARPGLDARLGVLGTASGSELNAVLGDGTRTYHWSGRQVRYAAAILPSLEDSPVSILLEQSFSAAQLTDQDGVCHGASSCQSYMFDISGSDLRLGRLALGNAHGSELQGLSLPLRIESWRDGNFQVEVQDTCSAPLLGNPAPVAGTFTGNLSAGETTPSRSGPSAGVGQVLMSAPGAGNDGSVQVSLPSQPAWLNYAWDGATRQQARGLATFGIYQGSPPLIYRRELYR